MQSARIIQGINSYELTSRLAILRKSAGNKFHNSHAYAPALKPDAYSQMPDVDCRIGRLQLEKVNNFRILFQPQIIEEIGFFSIAINHNGIVHERERCNNAAGFSVGAVGRQITVSHTLANLMSEKLIEFVDSTRKRRHILIVCVGHQSYFEINIQE